MQHLAGFAVWSDANQLALTIFLIVIKTPARRTAYARRADITSHADVSLRLRQTKGAAVASLRWRDI